MNCQTCGGETWNNTQKVQGGWKGPLFKCKDKNCGWVQWPPREKKATGGAPRANGVKWSSGDMARVYAWAVRTAGDQIATFAGKHKVPFSVENVVAGAATLFIGATNHGEPPKPQEQSLNERPQQLDDDEPY